jgi:putative acetyltransferase
MSSNVNLSHTNIEIRQAILDDAEGIVQVHYDAVHVTAAEHYDESILMEWSSRNRDRVTKLRNQISDNAENELMLVAVRNSVVIGFAEAVPSKCELRAVYVDPKCGRNGVGRLLLSSLEKLVVERGAEELWLDSSLTAQAFYAANGYTDEGTGMHRLRSGQEMQCVKMRKRLR